MEWQVSFQNRVFTTKLQIQAHVMHCSTNLVYVGSWVTCLSTLSHAIALYLPWVYCNRMRKIKHVANIVVHCNRYNRNAILKQTDRKLVSCFLTTALYSANNINYLQQLDDKTDFVNFMAVIRACELFQFQQTGWYFADDIFQYIYILGGIHQKEGQGSHTHINGFIILLKTCF